MTVHVISSSNKILAHSLNLELKKYSSGNYSNYVSIMKLIKKSGGYEYFIFIRDGNDGIKLMSTLDYINRRNFHCICLSHKEVYYYVNKHTSKYNLKFYNDTYSLVDFSNWSLTHFTSLYDTDSYNCGYVDLELSYRSGYKGNLFKTINDIIITLDCLPEFQLYNSVSIEYISAYIDKGEPYLSTKYLKGMSRNHIFYYSDNDTKYTYHDLLTALLSMKSSDKTKQMRIELPINNNIIKNNYSLSDSIHTKPIILGSRNSQFVFNT